MLIIYCLCIPQESNFSTYNVENYRIKLKKNYSVTENKIKKLNIKEYIQFIRILRYGSTDNLSNISINIISIYLQIFVIKKERNF